MAGGKEREAWSRYCRALDGSERIFRECLQLLGGLALRSRIVDESIFKITRLSDALIQESATNLATSISFTIPALDETVPSTMRRVARVRLSEWTFWTLPLISYEYAYVALEEASPSRLTKRFSPQLSAGRALPELGVRLFTLRVAEHDLNLTEPDLRRQGCDAAHKVRVLLARGRKEIFEQERRRHARSRSRGV